MSFHKKSIGFDVTQHIPVYASSRLSRPPIINATC